MRHPMPRAFAALLALSLTTAPTPAHALRAGFESTGAKEKIEVALTSTPRTGLEEPKTFALDSTEGKALTEQLGSAPTEGTISEILWVPAATVQAGRETLPAFPRPGQLPVFMEPPIFERLPDAIRTSKLISRHGFLPEQVPQADAAVLAWVGTPLSTASSHVPIFRFATADDVASLTEAPLVAAAMSQWFKNREIYWVPASAHLVTLNGQDGFAFYL